jgi:hypothetical protein
LAAWEKNPAVTAFLIACNVPTIHYGHFILCNFAFRPPLVQFQMDSANYFGKESSTMSSWKTRFATLEISQSGKGLGGENKLQCQNHKTEGGHPVAVATCSAVHAPPSLSSLPGNWHSSCSTIVMDCSHARILHIHSGTSHDPPVGISKTPVKSIRTVINMVIPTSWTYLRVSIIHPPILWGRWVIGRGDKSWQPFVIRQHCRK